MWYLEPGARTQKERWQASVDIDFLWKDGARPVYVMDNHRAALWCWLRELRATDVYSLVHIDAHWDITPAVKEAVDQLDGLGLADYLDAREKHPMLGSVPAIRWDTFITPLPRLRPLLHRGAFAVHQNDRSWHDSVLKEDGRFEVWTLEAFWNSFELSHYKGRKLIDLDLDYWVLRTGGRKMRAFSQDFIHAGLSALAGQLRSDDVVTIALSPDCCGSMETSKELCQLACDAFGVDCPDI